MIIVLYFLLHSHCDRFFAKVQDWIILYYWYGSLKKNASSYVFL